MNTPEPAPLHPELVEHREAWKGLTGHKRYHVRRKLEDEKVTYWLASMTTPELLDFVAGASCALVAGVLVIENDRPKLHIKFKGRRSMVRELLDRLLEWGKWSREKAAEARADPEEFRIKPEYRAFLELETRGAAVAVVGFDLLGREFAAGRGLAGPLGSWLRKRLEHAAARRAAKTKPQKPRTCTRHTWWPHPKSGGSWCPRCGHVDQDLTIGPDLEDEESESGV